MVEARARWATRHRWLVTGIAVVILAGSVLVGRAVLRGTPSSFLSLSYEQQTYTDAEAGMRITYPAGWERRDADAGPGFLGPVYAQNARRFLLLPGDEVGPGEPVSATSVCEMCGGFPPGTVIHEPHTAYVAFSLTPPPQPCPPVAPGEPAVSCHDAVPELEHYREWNRAEIWQDYLQAGADVVESDVELGGRPALRATGRFPARPPEIGPFSEHGEYVIGPSVWCARCEVVWSVTDWPDGWRIQFEVVLPEGSSERDRATALAIVDSIEQTSA